MTCQFFFVSPLKSEWNSDGGCKDTERINEVKTIIVKKEAKMQLILPLSDT